MQLPYSNTRVEHWNPGATRPLVLPVHLVCNTSDEAIHDNIRQNSRLPGKWIAAVDAHDGVAVLCGSGPSLADTLDDIPRGATVFAMNGAAKFLHDHGILADYQVMIDARPETADLIGPAREHLFASQVHPECFRRMPSARVWHLQVEGMDDLLPDYEDAYVLIGGAASVGNTATCLAYAMGYRTIHCHGYDSCHRDGKGHAFHQKMNDGDPCAFVRFKGRDYIASLTMKLQAEKFMRTSRELKRLGVHLEVHGSGLLPDMYNTRIEREADKYEHLWCHDDYRAFSPGEHCVATFLEIARPEGKVIDFGCGTGRAALRMKQAGLDVFLLDFTGNCRDLEAMTLPFLLHDLTQPIPVSAPYGFCADVLEHIPPDDVDTVIRNILDAAKAVFFQVSTEPDSMGEIIGEELHLCVRPHEWWARKFSAHGSVVWDSDGQFFVRSA